MFRKLRKIFSEKLGTKMKLAAFEKDYIRLEQMQFHCGKRFEMDRSLFIPCLNDNTMETGFDRHYVYHPAWAARIVKYVNPKKHIDISSTLHFCSILSAFVPVEFYDYRPARLELNHLKSLQGDLLNLPFSSNSLESISCMHTVEHVGLGRYGDPLDYDGDIKAIDELKRVVAPGGTLLFVVPLGGKAVICFNGHRIYSKEMVLSLFSDMELKEFAFIPEDENDGGIIVDPDHTLLSRQFYGCGCFWFTKP